MQKKEIFQLAELVNISSPDAVLEEVKYNFIHSYPIKEFIQIRMVYKDFLDLYSGRYPGYKNSTTSYHDIFYPMGTFLAFSRIIDGYNIENKVMPIAKVKIGLIASLFYDTGHLCDDNSAVQSRHVHDFVKKSIDFTKDYFKKSKFSNKDFDFASKIMKITDLYAEPGKIKFKGKAEQIVGYAVATADLTGQMAARTHLEKLFHLYDELREARIIKKSSIAEVLEKRVSLYRSRIMGKLEKDFKGLFKYFKTHFKKRYGINSNLYIDAIERQVRYLEEILKKSPRSYVKNLKRKSS